MNLRNHLVNAACLYGAALFLCSLAEIWIPGDQPQLRKTYALIEHTAVAYGAWAARNKISTPGNSAGVGEKPNEK